MGGKFSTQYKVNSKQFQEIEHEKFPPPVARKFFAAYVLWRKIKLSDVSTLCLNDSYLSNGYPIHFQHQPVSER